MGDLIVRIGGISVDYWDDLDFLTYLSERKPGERLAMRIIRAGTPKDVTVLVGLMPDSVRPAWRETVERARKKRLAGRLAR